MHVGYFTVCVACCCFDRPAIMPRMTEALVSSLCLKKGYYRTPELNEQLYLHFHGFHKIENLENFVACRALFLENNCIEEISGLDSMVELRALYLQHNALRTLSLSEPVNENREDGEKSASGIAAPPACLFKPFACLDTLNVEHNALTSLEGLQRMPTLKRFLGAHNRLRGDELANFSRHCPSVVVIDVSFNEIEPCDEGTVFEVVSKLKALASLKLDGNGMVKRTKNYRKRMIALVPTLHNLDDFPVFPDERRTAEAYVAGGVEAEKAMRLMLQEESDLRVKKQRDFFEKFLEEARRRPAPATTSYFEENSKDPEPMPASKMMIPVTPEDEDPEEEEVYIPKAVRRPPIAVSVERHFDPAVIVDEDLSACVQLDPEVAELFRCIDAM